MDVALKLLDTGGAHLRDRKIYQARFTDHIGRDGVISKTAGVRLCARLCGAQYL